MRTLADVMPERTSTTSPGKQPDGPPDADPLGWLAAAARQRSEAGLHRVLRPRAPRPRPGDTPGDAPGNAALPAQGSLQPWTDGDLLLDLAGNDYLGLARHPAVIEGGIAALRAFGAGSTGSRLVSGTTTLHGDLEAALAEHLGFASALVFSSGYAANLAMITALTGPGDLVVSDEHNHASLVDACRLSRADVVVTPHADVDAVDKALTTGTWRRAFVLSDSVFSADGDLAPLAALHGVVRRHGAVLLVDEAHGLGVVGDGGRGALAAAGLAGQPDVIATVTLSKSLGSQGGAVLGPAALRDHLIDTARTFIFDTGLAPACAGSALAALRLLTERPQLPEQVRRRAHEIAAATGAPEPAGAVVSVVLGDPERAVGVAAACREAGVAVGCFRPPTVPAGTSRLRVAARADLTDADVARAVGVITGSIARFPER
ncbi:8-amino-7-oxononanoate synthase [Parafrankia irregularis]|uniref:8-amino-7-oxononanoate synthase n=2 Tax=Parafrankia TaxID=2994362 RepID=A0A0S4QT86_9ACTN|nr:8-amino-7-oxononanoate synthase [Parafrankia irregularis]MBE3205221.1 8-amino-7-oxononanoate synthase [Parafrankia sp. CH37]CUU58821.1 8-amino-7-oxononanoate synthase [Parafrankia irregularis]